MPIKNAVELIAKIKEIQVKPEIQLTEERRQKIFYEYFHYLCDSYDFDLDFSPDLRKVYRRYSKENQEKIMAILQETSKMVQEEINSGNLPAEILEQYTLMGIKILYERYHIDIKPTKKEDLISEDKISEIREFDNSFIDDCFKGVIGYKQFTDTINFSKNRPTHLIEAVNAFTCHGPAGGPVLMSPFTDKNQLCNIFIVWLIKGCFQEKEHNEDKDYLLCRWANPFHVELILKNTSALPIYDNLTEYFEKDIFGETYKSLKNEMTELRSVATSVGQGMRTTTSFFGRLPTDLNKKIVLQVSGKLTPTEADSIVKDNFNRFNKSTL